MAYGDLNYLYDKGYRFHVIVQGRNDNPSYFSGLPYDWYATDDVKQLVVDRPDTTQNRAVASTLTFTLESTDGEWSPSEADAFTLRPRLEAGNNARVLMWNGIGWDLLWVGTVQDIREDFPKGRSRGLSQRITVTCRDDIDTIARAQCTSITAAGNNEDMGSRISRVLSNIGYSIYGSDDSRGNSRPLYQTELGENAMALLQRDAISTGNILYIQRDGKVAVVDPTTRSTSLWVYINPDGADPAPPVGTDPVAIASGVTVQHPLVGVVNQVELNGENAGVYAVKVTDATSISDYGLRAIKIEGTRAGGTTQITDTANSYLNPDPVPQLSNLVIPLLAPEHVANDYLRDWVVDTMEVGEQVKVHLYPQGDSAWGQEVTLTLRGWRLAVDSQNATLMLRLGTAFPWQAGAVTQRSALATVTDVSAVESQLTDKVDVSGDTMTGILNLYNSTNYVPYRSYRVVGGTEYRGEFGVSSVGPTLLMRTLNSSNTEQATFRLPMSTSGQAALNVGLDIDVASDAILAGNAGTQPDGPLRIKQESGGQGRIGFYASGWQEWILIGADKIQWGTQGSTRMNLHSGGDLSVQGAIRAGDVSTSALTNGYLYATPGSSSGWDAHWALAAGSTYYLVRVTSTRRDKKYITYRDDLADVALAPIRYKRRRDRGGDITPGWQYGFLAEDIAEQDTDGALTLLDEEGLPAGYSTHGLLAVLAAKANRAEDELAELRRELQQVRRALP